MFLLQMDDAILFKTLQLLPPRSARVFASIDKKTHALFRKDVEHIIKSSALCVQKFWRIQRICFSTRSLVSAILNGAQLRESDVATMRFQEFVQHIRKKGLVINPFRRLFSRIDKIACRILTPEERMLICRDLPSRKNIRVFITAYMIKHYPGNVFESMGSAESKVLDASVELIAAFETTVDYLDRVGTFQKLPKEIAIRFAASLSAFWLSFSAWKAADAMVLLPRLQEGLGRMLYVRNCILQRTDFDQPELLHFTESRINMTRQQILGIAGAAGLEQANQDAEAEAARMMAQMQDNEGERVAITIQIFRIQDWRDD